MEPRYHYGARHVQLRGQTCSASQLVSNRRSGALRYRCALNQLRVLRRRRNSPPFQIVEILYENACPPGICRIISTPARQTLCWCWHGHCARRRGVQAHGPRCGRCFRRRHVTRPRPLHAERGACRRYLRLAVGNLSVSGAKVLRCGLAQSETRSRSLLTMPEVEILGRVGTGGRLRSACLWRKRSLGRSAGKLSFERR